LGSKPGPSGRRIITLSPWNSLGHLRKLGEQLPKWLRHSWGECEQPPLELLRKLDISQRIELSIRDVKTLLEKLRTLL